MTETEWMECTDPEAMLQQLVVESASDRKLRLFACACCRSVDFKMHRRSRKAVDVAERYADGLATEEQLRTAHHRAQGTYYAINDNAGNRPWYPDVAASLIAMYAAAEDVRRTCSEVCRNARAASSRGSAESVLQSHLLRDIFGSSFRPEILLPVWLTLHVVGLARAIYEERTFDRMPELADALRDARCDNQEILTHCRQQGAHVLGCWVIDLLLAKK